MVPAPNPPLVSVIIPAFKASGHIADALNSVFSQGFIDYEVIVVNDGSPDSDLLEQALKPYISRINYSRQENLGPSAARNSGIHRARGEWLAFLDSDDIWLPNYLGEQLSFLRSNAALDMVYCNATLNGGAGESGKTFMDVCPSTGPVTFESVLVEQCQVLTSGTMIRKQILERSGLFDEKLRCSEDHDLWLRILHCGDKAAYQRKVLLRRNVRPEGQGSAPGGLLEGEIQSLKKLDLELDLHPATRSILRDRLRKIEAAHALIQGKALLRAGDVMKAYESLSRAYADAPNSKLRVMLLCLKIAPSLAVRGARFWQRRTPSLRQA